MNHPGLNVALAKTSDHTVKRCVCLQIVISEYAPPGSEEILQGANGKSERPYYGVNLITAFRKRLPYHIRYHPAKCRNQVDALMASTLTQLSQLHGPRT